MLTTIPDINSTLARRKIRLPINPGGMNNGVYRLDGGIPLSTPIRRSALSDKADY
jgi:hypothetical protein